MRALSVLIYFLFFAICLGYSQNNNNNNNNNKPFKDPSTGKYGVKNKHTDKILIEPKYERIVDLNDSLIIVENSANNYGVIDYKEKTKVSFSNYPVYFYSPDSNTLKFYEITPERYKSWAFYYIDSSRFCIPSLDYPCPYWKDFKTDKLSPVLKLTQKAIYFRGLDRMDSALLYNDSTLLILNKDPYVYLNWANMLLCDKYFMFKKENSLTQSQIIKVDSILEQSFNYANDSKSKIRINNTRYDFYKYIQRDKNQLKKVKNQNKSLDADEISKGNMIFIGANFMKNGEFEIGFGNGLITKQNHFNFSNFVLDGLMALGLSYSKDFKNNVDGYKLHFFSFLKPVSGGIYPILYTDYKNNDFVVRPEIGVGLNYFTFNLGYNIICDKNKEFKNRINTLCFSVRYYLPIKAKKFYTSK